MPGQPGRHPAGQAPAARRHRSRRRPGRRTSCSSAATPASRCASSTATTWCNLLPRRPRRLGQLLPGPGVRGHRHVAAVDRRPGRHLRRSSRPCSASRSARSSGWKPGTWLDSLVPATTLLAAVPYFWLALLLVYLLRRRPRLVPAAGRLRRRPRHPGWNLAFIALGDLRTAFLPALTIVHRVDRRLAARHAQHDGLHPVRGLRRSPPRRRA